MALRLAGEPASVVQGLDALGWLRSVAVSSASPALALQQSGSGPILNLKDPSLTASHWLATFKQAEAFPRLRIRWDSARGVALEIGEGASAPDINLYRLTVNMLATDDELVSIRSAAADPAFSTRISGDSVARGGMDADGRLRWGPGNAAVDTDLYRSAAGTLAWKANGATPSELGRGATDADITYVALRNASGTLVYIYPNATGDGVVASTTKP